MSVSLRVMPYSKDRAVFSTLNHGYQQKTAEPRSLWYRGFLMGSICPSLSLFSSICSLAWFLALSLEPRS